MPSKRFTTEDLYVIDENGVRVATVHPRIARALIQPTDLADAYSRVALFAAAPRMRDLLHELVDHIERRSPHESRDVTAPIATAITMAKNLLRSVEEN